MFSCDEKFFPVYLQLPKLQLSLQQIYLIFKFETIVSICSAPETRSGFSTSFIVVLSLLRFSQTCEL